MDDDDVDDDSNDTLFKHKSLKLLYEEKGWKKRCADRPDYKCLELTGLSLSLLRLTRQMSFHIP